MTNMSIQPLWLTYFIEILLVLNSNSQKSILARFLIRPILDPKFPLMSTQTRKQECGILQMDLQDKMCH